jgi:hypothetical protein
MCAVSSSTERGSTKDAKFTKDAKDQSTLDVFVSIVTFVPIVCAAKARN